MILSIFFIFNFHIHFVKGGESYVAIIRKTMALFNQIKRVP